MDPLVALEYPNFIDPPVQTAELSGRGATSIWREAGQYSWAIPGDGGVYLARDPLGCNKLFFGARPDGRVVVANRLERALSLGVPADRLRSCPPGHLVWSDGRACRDLGGSDLPSIEATDDFDLAGFQDRVRKCLEGAFAGVRRRYPRARFAVCLSGGLDSSVIAALAATWLPSPVAVSFSFLEPADLRHWAGEGDLAGLTSLSEDFGHAASVAEALGLPLLPVFRPREAVMAAVGPALRLCQDWRDFNVHCAVVNLFLAEDIRARFPGEEVVVLTGDLMNEFVCDYREERVDGTVYYRQPNVSLEKRRRMFVRGLDAGDREIGVINAFGMPVFQAYAWAAEAYLGVPADILAEPDAKDHLNGHLLPAAVSARVSRAKRRAQVGGRDGGVLAVFHRAGLDQGRLKALWAAQLPPETRGDRPHDLIQIGRYRQGERSD